MGSFVALLSTFFLILLPFWIFICFLVIKWIYPTTPVVSKIKLPPSPPKLPIIGNLHQLSSLPHRSLWALAQRHGPIMLLHLGRVPVLVVSAADVAKEIVKSNDVIFSNRPKSSTFARLLYDYKGVSTAPYGEYWRQIRSVCVLHLLSTRRVQSFRAVREEETALLMDKISSSSSSSSTPIDLSHMFLSLTNDIICRVALGRKYSGDETGKRFSELLKDFVGLLSGFNVGDYIPWLSWVNFLNGLDAKVDKVAKEFDRFLEGVLKDHLGKRKRGSGDQEMKDFVDVLLDLQENNVTGVAITEVCIKALNLDMFAAGSDTTYTVLEWAMTELLRHPQVMKKLQNEVRGISGGKLITEDDLNKMQYLKAVIKETLRVHPPIPLLVPRESTQDSKIMGYDIAAGTKVVTNAWAIGRDPQLWDEAEEFRPERFLNSCIDFKGQDFELIPFGAGRRGCPGTLFAAMTIEIALANIVNRFDWEVGGGGGAKDLDMTECTGLTIHRKVPLLAVATPWLR